jgi:hypothetical protein
MNDTFNWVTLKDTFQADSAYKYIIIGCSVPKNNIDTVRIKSSGSQIAYYYIDNVRVQTLSSVTEVEKLNLSYVSISPNPVKDKAVIRLSDNSGLPYSISLINMMGQIVWQRSDIVEKEVVLERQSLSAGLYFYQLNRKGQTVQKGKAILE